MFFDTAIFDLDNTLYSYSDCHKVALNLVLDELSKDCNLDKTDLLQNYELISNNLKVELGVTASSHNRFIYFKQLLGWYGIALDLVMHYHDLYWHTFYAAMRPFDGAIELLEFFKTNKIQLILLSDFQIQHQFEKLVTLGILHYFDDVITSEEVGVEKPNSKMFLSALSRINRSPERVIMIGDSFDKDIQGAIKCGIYGFWINNKPVVASEGNYMQFPSLCEFAGWIADWNKELQKLQILSRYCGERFDLTQAAGGNISFKLDGHLVIKSSGFLLSDIDLKSGYSIVDNTRLMNDLVGNHVQDLNEYLVFSKRKASIETFMHSVLGKYTLHLHPLQVNEILTGVEGRATISALFPDAMVIDYVTPGRAIADQILKQNRNGIIFLMNHGLIITASEYGELVNLLEDILTKCEQYSGISYEKYKMVSALSVLLNNVTNLGHLVYLCEDTLIRENFSKLDNIYPTFPDSVVYCGSEILYLSELDEQEVRCFVSRSGTPKLVVFSNELYIFDASLKKCRETESVFKSVLLLREAASGQAYLSATEVDFLSNWDAEKYRKTLVN